MSVRPIHLFLIALLAGCPFVGDGLYDREIVDFDGDGLAALRFGGPDCRDDDPSIGDCDVDDDGALAANVGGLDCDDNRADIHPTAPEVCDGVDNDCDGQADNADPDAVGLFGVWVDADGDGHGDPDLPLACQESIDGVPVHALNGDDCDDDDSDVHPDRDERCDGFDNNCDGVTDDVGLWFVDEDGDGVGRDELGEGSCDLTATTGLSDRSGDCDDQDPTIAPGLEEVLYDGIDQNCSGGRDDWDGDFDHFVPPEHWAAAQSASAAAPDGPWELFLGDCNDTDATANPEGIEVCDGLDNDCDGLVDSQDLDPDDPLTEPVLFTQSIVVFFDGDGDHAAGARVRLCPAEVDTAIHSLHAEDCYDIDEVPEGYESLHPAEVHPAAAEICDGVDNNCDGLADSADPHVDLATTPVWYLDADGDDWGIDDGTGITQCDRPAGRSSRLGDCDDTDSALNPGAPWHRDLDLDGAGDPNSATPTPDCHPPDPTGWILDGNDCNDSSAIYNPDTLWYADADGDGFGSPTTIVNACNPGSGWVLSTAGEDCNDSDPDSLASTAYFLDLDGDGSGDPTTRVEACSLPSTTEPWVTLGADCDDDDPARHPLRLELCNAIDDDCDGAIDDADADVVVFGSDVVGFEDADGDGVGGVVQRGFCAFVGEGFSPLTGDCDDDDPTRSPRLPEMCGNHIDDDCDGVEQTPNWYEDQDLDGFGGTLIVTDCTQPAGTTHLSGDCDDGVDSISPDAMELTLCDGVDQDCDGTVEPRTDWSRDADGDGLGAAATTLLQCLSPGPGWVRNDLDCDDTDPDAGGRVVGFLDQDLDGVGGSVAVDSCSPPLNVVSTSDDCDDLDPTRRPGFAERCGDGVDNNCDGVFLTTEASSGAPSSPDPRWDAPNPITNEPVQLDPDGPDLGDYPFYVASVDGDHNYSISHMGILCFAEPDLDGFGFEGGFVPAIQPEESELLTGYLDCEAIADDGSGHEDRGTLGAPDLDSDGVPFFENPLDLVLICGSSPPGIAPIDLELFSVDCAPEDPFARYSVEGLYPDNDGDGEASPGVHPFPGCVFPKPSRMPGTDCDDTDKDPVDGTEFFVGSAQDLANVINTCAHLPDGLHLKVDPCNARWPADGGELLAPPDRLILEGTDAFATCNDAFLSEVQAPLIFDGLVEIRNLSLDMDLEAIGTHSMLDLVNVSFEGAITTDGSVVFDSSEIIVGEDPTVLATAGASLTVVRSSVTEHPSVLDRTSSLVTSDGADVDLIDSTIDGLGTVATLQDGSLFMQDCLVTDTSVLIQAGGTTPVDLERVDFEDLQGSPATVVDVELGPVHIVDSRFQMVPSILLHAPGPMVHIGGGLSTATNSTFWREDIDQALWRQDAGTSNLDDATFYQDSAVALLELAPGVVSTIDGSLLYQDVASIGVACPVVETGNTTVVNTWSHHPVAACMTDLSNSQGSTGFDADLFPLSLSVRGLYGHRP